MEHRSRAPASPAEEECVADMKCVVPLCDDITHFIILIFEGKVHVSIRTMGRSLCVVPKYHATADTTRYIIIQYMYKRIQIIVYVYKLEFECRCVPIYSQPTPSSRLAL